MFSIMNDETCCSSCLTCRKHTSQLLFHVQSFRKWGTAGTKLPSPETNFPFGMNKVVYLSKWLNKWVYMINFNLLSLHLVLMFSVLNFIQYLNQNVFNVFLYSFVIPGSGFSITVLGSKTTFSHSVVQTHPELKKLMLNFWMLFNDLNFSNNKIWHSNGK